MMLGAGHRRGGSRLRRRGNTEKRFEEKFVKSYLRGCKGLYRV